MNVTKLEEKKQDKIDISDLNDPDNLSEEKIAAIIEDEHLQTYLANAHPR